MARVRGWRRHRPIRRGMIVIRRIIETLTGYGTRYGRGYGE